jgi:type II secretory pathway pseudopilin PulG
MRIRRFRSGRRAATLSELMIVVTLVGILTGFALPQLLRGYDRMEARSAARETATAFFVGRASAVAAGRQANVVIDAPHAGLRVIRGGDTVLALPVGVRHGVAVAATRQSMIYTAAGLGYGGANLRVILSRGSAAETVLVSREGRVRIGSGVR